MKVIAVVGGMVIFCLVFACARAVDLEKAKQEIQMALDQYVASVESEDMGQYANRVCHDMTMTNFGAFGAPIVGWDGLRDVMENQNAGLDSTKIDQSEVQIHVYPSGISAWATSLWNFRAKAGENVLDLTVRCTWVLEKRGEKWEIVHFHKSIAAG